MRGLGRVFLHLSQIIYPYLLRTFQHSRVSVTVLSTASLLPTCSYSSIVYDAIELLSSTPKQLLGSMEAGGENIRNIGQI